MNEVSNKVTEESVALAQLLSLVEGEASDSRHGRALRVDAILSSAHVDSATRICALLVICPRICNPSGSESVAKVSEAIAKRYGTEVASLVSNMAKVDSLHARIPTSSAQHKSGTEVQLSPELLRRMLLSMAEDIRVVIVFLSMRLDLLRHYAIGHDAVDLGVCLETREILVPLANRLGLGFLKWELEDLAFRFLEPTAYKTLAKALDEKRLLRERSRNSKPRWLHANSMPWFMVAPSISVALHKN
jgi:GTP pyrophosphokinase